MQAFILFPLLGLMLASQPAKDTDCLQLSELECIQSSQCILDQHPEDQKYFCREVIHPCEEGFIQHPPEIKTCESKEGCEFIPGHCYCPPGVFCVCGGGPPPRCVPKPEPIN